MPTEKSPFAQEFDFLIASKKTTYSRFAKAVGVSAPYVTQIMSGARVPSQEFVRKTEDFFSLDENEKRKLRQAASASQKKITITATTYSEAREILEFKQELEKRRAACGEGL